MYNIHTMLHTLHGYEERVNSSIVSQYALIPCAVYVHILGMLDDLHLHLLHTVGDIMYMDCSIYE